LKEVFETHLEESATQVERLVQVFEIIGKPARAKTCEAMQGLTSEMTKTWRISGRQKPLMSC
jgi:ferritin-like metal-binding protein YciE